MELLGNVTVVAVEAYRRRRTGGSPGPVTATATVDRLTDVTGHGLVDLDVAEQSTPDPGSGFVRLFLVQTADPQVAEQFGWKISLDGGKTTLRIVQVPAPTPGSPGYREVTVGGQVYPAVWLLDLADFSGPSGAVGPPAYYTKAEADDRTVDFVETHDTDAGAHADIRAQLDAALDVIADLAGRVHTLEAGGATPPPGTGLGSAPLGSTPLGGPTSPPSSSSALGAASLGTSPLGGST